MDDERKARELRPLESISDNYPKYILTMDQSIFNDYSGIKVVNIIDFLLE
jgi:predicted AAA+ superfamily ATPase